MKLLIDNNLPPRLGRGLGALFVGEHDVQHIKDKFGTGDLPDEEWIERLGREGDWAVLSGDRRIVKHRPSRDLFLRSNLIGFFPLPAVMKLALPAMTARVLTLWPVLETTTRTMERGCFEVGIKGDRIRPIS